MVGKFFGTGKHCRTRRIVRAQISCPPLTEVELTTMSGLSSQWLQSICNSYPHHRGSLNMFSLLRDHYVPSTLCKKAVSVDSQ
ncbi:uncharacterized protein PHALS_09925 [Plasmopara halstedii]|uniref:Uncharacterized protein n=1 Tax=Plasmopara halstedii TaxID=4781 RepID=A0A0P1AFN8_PLAHL|nr:uncharacterized protein PHALS_09925 [Plasmopara halstedii]CEG39689.1 hypothetical protein PHALS_09925 [Plasmopara halstedii]|eukprot:XP_024576058.1 hypothetical protein PHALS_09925 [Plasmopara halstedii]